MELKVPPPIVFLVSVGIMRLMVGRGVLVLYEQNAVSTVVALCLLVAALVIGVAGLAAFRTAGTTFNPRNPRDASVLVRSGIYGRTRNPMYLGMVLALAAGAVYWGDLGAVLVVPLFILFMNRFQIKPEERALRANFGVAYDEYRAEVRRWL